MSTERPCPHCHARPGKPCTVPGTITRTQQPHKWRFQQRAAKGNDGWVRCAAIACKNKFTDAPGVPRFCPDHNERNP